MRTGDIRLTLIDAVAADFASKGIVTRRQAGRLIIVGWGGCVAYVEFSEPGGPVISADAGLGWALRVIPRRGRRNWDHCRLIEAQIRSRLRAPDVNRKVEGRS